MPFMPQLRSPRLCPGARLRLRRILAVIGVTLLDAPAAAKRGNREGNAAPLLRSLAHEIAGFPALPRGVTAAPRWSVHSHGGQIVRRRQECESTTLP